MDQDPEPAWLDGPLTRPRDVFWQAVGRCVEGLGMDGAQAQELLRARALHLDLTVDELARDITRGQVSVQRLRPSSADEPSQAPTA